MDEKIVYRDRDLFEDPLTAAGSFLGYTDSDTKLTVWSGTCAAPVCVGGNDDDLSCTFNTLQSTVTWTSVAGETYYIMVHGFSSNVGDFELTLDCEIPVELMSFSAE